MNYEDRGDLAKGLGWIKYKIIQRMHQENQINHIKTKQLLGKQIIVHNISRNNGALVLSRTSNQKTECVSEIITCILVATR